MQIFAHRGLSSLYPENTMAAFKAAASLDIDGIELDVQLTGDLVPIVIHDAILDRTTTGTGVIKQHTFAELREYSAGAHFSLAHTEEKIPSLEEVLRWALGNQLILNLELKDSSFLLVELVLELIKTYQLTDRVIISSFDHELISRIQGVPTAIITSEYIPDVERYLSLIGTKGYHFCDYCIPKEEALALNKKGYHLRPYTVNHQERIRELLDWNLSGIFTDYPQIAQIERAASHKG